MRPPRTSPRAVQPNAGVEVRGPPAEAPLSRVRKDAIVGTPPPAATVPGNGPLLTLLQSQKAPIAVLQQIGLQAQALPPLCEAAVDGVPGKTEPLGLQRDLRDVTPGLARLAQHGPLLRRQLLVQIDTGNDALRDVLGTPVLPRRSQPLSCGLQVDPVKFD